MVSISIPVPSTIDELLNATETYKSYSTLQLFVGTETATSEI